VDRQKTPYGIFTEDIWNTSSSLEHQPYSYSKTLAEKEAWKINEKQTRWDNDYPIPRRVMPKWLVWLVAPMVNKAMTRKIISLNVNLPWAGDNSKSIRDLNMQYRPMKKSMIDFFQQMIDSGLLKQTP
jgi:hypothetical protein